MTTAAHRATAVRSRTQICIARAAISDPLPALLQDRQLRLPPQRGPAPAVAARSLRHDQDRRTVGASQGADVLREASLGLPDDRGKLGDGKRRRPPTVISEFEDLQPVLCDGDAHAL